MGDVTVITTYNFFLISNRIDTVQCNCPRTFYSPSYIVRGMSVQNSNIIKSIVCNRKECCNCFFLVCRNHFHNDENTVYLRSAMLGPLVKTGLCVRGIFHPAISARIKSHLHFKSILRYVLL